MLMRSVTGKPDDSRIAREPSDFQTKHRWLVDNAGIIVPFIAGGTRPGDPNAIIDVSANRHLGFITHTAAPDAPITRSAYGSGYSTGGTTTRVRFKFKAHRSFSVREGGDMITMMWLARPFPHIVGEIQNDDYFYAYDYSAGGGDKWHALFNRQDGLTELDAFADDGTSNKLSALTGQPALLNDEMATVANIIHDNKVQLYSRGVFATGTTVGDIYNEGGSGTGFLQISGRDEDVRQMHAMSVLAFAIFHIHPGNQAIDNIAHDLSWLERKAVFALKAPAAVGGRIMSSLVRHGGLVGVGGIAGHGGGLAG